MVLHHWYIHINIEDLKPCDCNLVYYIYDIIIMRIRNIFSMGARTISRSSKKNGILVALSRLRLCWIWLDWDTSVDLFEQLTLVTCKTWFAREACNRTIELEICDQDHRNKRIVYDISYGPLTRYVELRIAHAPGMPRTFSPPLTSKKNAS